jgi:hypothetical protein
MSEPMSAFERRLADALGAEADDARLGRRQSDVVSEVLSRPARWTVRNVLSARLATVLAGVAVIAVLVLVVLPRMPTSPAKVPVASPPVDREELLEIARADLSAERRMLRIEFVGGAPFQLLDPCSVGYTGWTRVVGEELHVALWESHRPPRIAPVACPAVGFRRELELPLEAPFGGNLVRDLKGYVHFLARPAGMAVLELAAGWQLAEEATIMSSASGGWRQRFTRDPVEESGRGSLMLYQFFGAASPYGGEAGRSSVEVNGQPATLWREANGQLVLRWRLAEHGLTLIAHRSDFTQDQLIALAESARLNGPGPAAPTPTESEAATAEATDGRYRLVLHVPATTWRAGETITGLATLSLLEGDSVQIAGSTSPGVMGFKFTEVGGRRNVEPVWTSDCGAQHVLAVATPLEVPLRSTGGHSSPSDPDWTWYREFFARSELVLPAGEWDITAVASFNESWGCPPTGARVGLTATIRVTISP